MDLHKIRKLIIIYLVDKIDDKKMAIIISSDTIVKLNENFMEVKFELISLFRRN